MSCYCKEHSCIRLGICCEASPCNCRNKQGEQQNSQTGKTHTIIQDIQRNFATLLQKQLHKLGQAKQHEIHELEHKISKLKSQIFKLQSRNKLDKDNQNILKQQVRKHSNRIQQLQAQLMRERANRKTTQNIHKQIVIKSIQNIQLPNQKKSDINPQVNGLKQQLVKLRTRIFELQQTNKDLLQRLAKIDQQNQGQLLYLEKQIKQLQSELANKNSEIQKFRNQKIHLSQKIQILSKPTKIQKQPIILRQIITQPPQIKTVYVDRPVQTTKVVQIQRVVKQFVQPERPVVNRIIQCPPSKKCRCDSDSSSQQKYSQKNIYQQQQLRTQYNGLVNSFKQQRQKLVKAINNRDSDYRLLEKKIQLCQKINANQTKNKNCQGSVDVQVTVLKDGTKYNSQSSNQDRRKQTGIRKQTAMKSTKTVNNTKRR